MRSGLAAVGRSWPQVPAWACPETGKPTAPGALAVRGGASLACLRVVRRDVHSCV